MHWFDSRLLRSARPFVPSGLPSSFSRSPSDQQIDGGGAETATEDDQAMVAMMCDLVLSEIQAEIDRAERETERRRQEELRLTNQPDYSWLMDWRLRSKRPLGFRESSEVELLCAKVRPGEWRRVLKEWRIRVRFVESRDEILSTFRAVVEEQVGERMQRECRLVVEEDEQGHGTQSLGNMANIGASAAAPKVQQKPRPKTARSPRIPFPAAQQLSVFSLTLPMERDENC